MEIDRERIEVSEHRVIIACLLADSVQAMVCSSSKSREMSTSVRTQPPRSSHQMPCNGLWTHTCVCNLIEIFAVLFIIQ